MRRQLLNCGYKTPGHHRFVLVSACWLFAISALAEETGDHNSAAMEWDSGGHTKYQFIYTDIPESSVLRAVSGDSMQDNNLEARLKISAKRNRWDVSAHTQFMTVYSDTLKASRELPGELIFANGVINDDRRWFNLTHAFNNAGRSATVLRLDRINVGFTGDKTVIRFGRQAISWGNGMLFNPMDILNPFDPAAVDKEYKTGDDMLYAQYLLDNGNDLQAVAVVRRDIVTGEVESGQSSLAGKLHGFWGASEYDLLIADHYGDTLLGIGASTGVGGALWRGDLVWVDTRSESVYSAVTGVSYSWVAGGHNWSGAVEYYYSGFGQSGGDYSPPALAGNPELLKRLARGEIFNLARHYLGVSVMVELSPLLNLTPNLFINLTDPSALTQLVLAYDWKQDIQVLAALSIPLGPAGSEYGGINTGQAGEYFSTGPSLFAQLAWYF